MAMKPFPERLKEAEECQKCIDHHRPYKHIDPIDIMIFHENDHRWPGYAGEPSSGDFGGSDF